MKYRKLCGWNSWDCLWKILIELAWSSSIGVCCWASFNPIEMVFIIGINNLSWGKLFDSCVFVVSQWCLLGASFWVGFNSFVFCRVIWRLKVLTLWLKCFLFIDDRNYASNDICSQVCCSLMHCWGFSGLFGCIWGRVILSINFAGGLGSGRTQKWCSINPVQYIFPRLFGCSINPLP